LEDSIFDAKIFRLSGRDDEEDDVSFCLVVLSDVCLEMDETECAGSMSTLVAL
jgi:hypothetical protein